MFCCCCKECYFLVKPCFYFFHGRFLSERETADRNYALGYYINAHKVKQYNFDLGLLSLVSFLVSLVGVWWVGSCGLVTLTSATLFNHPSSTKCNGIVLVPKNIDTLQAGNFGLTSTPTLLETLVQPTSFLGPLSLGCRAPQVRDRSFNKWHAQRVIYKKNTPDHDYR